ncbi:lipoprotein insertase outer membrane protein LolB [Psychrobacter frigidicola]|uniref:lipoprotein insertase outer membrane protein LolB n=1 Tax=Psychrobacter frigidicola TaxID=45611 RepID=UPI001918BD1F|nr:lipoprotein insertase outer membrane protein LolB [Psychrobacter frigidicola]
MSAIHTSLHRITNKTTKLATSGALTAMLAFTAGCQSLPGTTATSKPTPTVQAHKLDNFNINGKIGVTMPKSTPADTGTDVGTEGGSAFYAWGQQNERFAIELIGALGIGKTNIEYDGQTATLVSEKTGTLTANNPETLLQKATGWQAPISQMPYWISGRSAPSDSAPQVDAQNRLISSVNSAWTANFTYKGNDKLPNKISAVQPQGQKVVMTINHQNR